MQWDLQTDRKYLSTLIELGRKATALRPQVATNWETLARHLIQIGNDQEALSILKDAVAKFPTDVRLHLMLADACYGARQVEDAHSALRKAQSFSKLDNAEQILLQELSIKTKITENIEELATSILSRDPANVLALTALGKSLRRSGRIEIMIPICQAALDREPWHTCARYELAVALDLIGSTEKAGKLFEVDQFVTVKELEIPQRYSDAQSFASALENEIETNPTLKQEPAGKATKGKGGSQTMPRLPHGNEEALPRLLDLVRSEVDAYEAKLALADNNDSFVKHIPKRAWLNSWGVVCRIDGYQTAHIHPDGWLSGVYYVTAPVKPAADRRGCFILGASEIKESTSSTPSREQYIDPIPGRLILFPSFVPHSTVPTESTDPRISISFDVIPIRSAS